MLAKQDTEGMDLFGCNLHSAGSECCQHCVYMEPCAAQSRRREDGQPLPLWESFCGSPEQCFHFWSSQNVG